MGRGPSGIPLLEACRSYRFFLLLLALSLPVAAPVAATPISVLLIGDSITVGRVSEPAGQPYRLLLADALGGDYEVAHVACGGTSSLDWTVTSGNGFCASTFTPPTIYEARARPELPADIVTVMLGTNDAFGYFEAGGRVHPDDYAAAIGELVHNLLTDGAGWVVLMTPPPYPFPSDTVAHARLGLYRDEILAICGAAAQVVCGPDVYGLLGFDDFEYNNVHPNRFGSQKIADALFGTITGLPVPEPSTGGLLALGLSCIAAGRIPSRGRSARRSSRSRHSGRRTASARPLR